MMKGLKKNVKAKAQIAKEQNKRRMRTKKKKKQRRRKKVQGKSMRGQGGARKETNKKILIC